MQYSRLFVFAVIVVISSLVGCTSLVKTESVATEAAKKAESFSVGYPDGYKDWTNTFGKVV